MCESVFDSHGRTFVSKVEGARTQCGRTGTMYVCIPTPTSTHAHASQAAWLLPIKKACGLPCLLGICCSTRAPLTLCTTPTDKPAPHQRADIPPPPPWLRSLSGPSLPRIKHPETCKLHTYNKCIPQASVTTRARSSKVDEQLQQYRHENHDHHTKPPIAAGRTHIHPRTHLPHSSLVKGCTFSSRTFPWVAILTCAITVLVLMG